MGSGESKPSINDVSTDLDQAPEYRARQGVQPLSEHFKAEIRRAYANLQPLRVENAEPGAVLDAAARAARRMRRWKLTVEDREGGHLEGVATTAVMRFKDDFVVRVRPAEGGVVVVDMRSRSRVGTSDFGANAKRILAYWDVLRAELG